MTKIELLMVGGERFEMEWEPDYDDVARHAASYLATMAADHEFVRATRIQGLLGIPDLGDYRVAAANIVAWRILP